jgi:hypothetical protein
MAMRALMARKRNALIDASSRGEFTVHAPFGLRGLMLHLWCTERTRFDVMGLTCGHNRLRRLDPMARTVVGVDLGGSQLEPATR